MVNRMNLLPAAAVADVHFVDPRLNSARTTAEARVALLKIPGNDSSPPPNQSCLVSSLQFQREDSLTPSDLRKAECRYRGERIDCGMGNKETGSSDPRAALGNRLLHRSSANPRGGVAPALAPSIVERQACASRLTSCQRRQSGAGDCAGRPRYWPKCVRNQRFAHCCCPACKPRQNARQFRSFLDGECSPLRPLALAPCSPSRWQRVLDGAAFPTLG
jgi:hypothetical protein